MKWDLEVCLFILPLCDRKIEHFGGKLQLSFHLGFQMNHLPKTAP
jgi:hypothetical protein